MEIAAPFTEAADAIIGSGGRDLNVCFQCATCTGSCPWGWVNPLNMRHLIRLAQLGLEGYEGEELWRCTTCGTCQERCPRGVDILGLVQTIRGMIVEAGVGPRTIGAAMGAVSTDGNPWGGDRAKRNDWAAGVLPHFDPARCEYLLFGCCMPSYDVRSRSIALAAASVFKAAELAVGVLGTAESCCAESARRAGHEQLFRRVAAQNADELRRARVERIVVLSPHCLHALKSDYASLGYHVEVEHISQLLLRLLQQGKLRLPRTIDRVVTYHDPCYLGRHHGVYDEPREVLRALPGVRLVEMIRTRESSLCCGGGGGRMWMETPVGERFGDLRVPEALGVGAKVIATACPYCVSMLEASRTGLGVEERIDVRDVTELVAEALG